MGATKGGQQSTTIRVTKIRNSICVYLCICVFGRSQQSATIRVWECRFLCELILCIRIDRHPNIFMNLVSFVLRRAQYSCISLKFKFFLLLYCGLSAHNAIVEVLIGRLISDFENFPLNHPLVGSND